MIKAEFCFDEYTDRITKVSVSGHAFAAEYGSDVVCAAVSSLLIATINGLEEYVGLDTKANVENGKTGFIIPEEDPTQAIQAQAIVHTFYLAMTGLEEEYPDNVEVTLGEDKGDYYND